MLDAVRQVLREALQLGSRADMLDVASPLLGGLPELDSMAAVSLITALEERFGFAIDDDDISADTFATLGSLTAFVEQKAGT